ncbi:MAG: ribonuclease HI [Clostridiales bacterium]|nr:ribonuclease HI [Clostridiales bacterium]
MEKKKVEIYTDGACSGNPGPGGYGVILRWNGHEKELSGGEASTTNNRMELMGVITALEALKEPCSVELYTDSKYVVDAVNLGWAKRWRASGWKKNRTEQAKNPDLWERVLKLLEYHEVKFIWVKGHAQNSFNNRCDALAVAQSRKFL